MMKLTVAAVALLVGWGGVFAAVPAAADQAKVPGRREALRLFGADHHMAILGLEHVGNESAPSLLGSRPALIQLQSMLEGYGYVAIWPQAEKHGAKILPERLIIIGRNGNIVDRSALPRIAAKADIAPPPAMPAEPSLDVVTATNTAPASTQQPATTAAMVISARLATLASEPHSYNALANPGWSGRVMSSPRTIALLNATLLPQIRILAASLQTAAMSLQYK